MLLPLSKMVYRSCDVHRTTPPPFQATQAMAPFVSQRSHGGESRVCPGELCSSTGIAVCEISHHSWMAVEVVGQILEGH